MKKLYFAIVLATIALVGCGHKLTNTDNDEPIQPEAVQQQKPSIDSLLKGVVRASEMELPALWTDTIYDTCQTIQSSDGKYCVFIGRAEEDKVREDQHVVELGPLSEEGRVSVFLFDNEKRAVTLIATTSPEGLGLHEPQIDIKNEYVYYFRESDRLGLSLFRFCLRTKKEEYLTGCYYHTTYSLLPNGNILFQDIREQVYVWDSSAFVNEEYAVTGWLGYVFCDIEMSPSGVCTKKSRFYTYTRGDRSTLTYDFDDDDGIINNESLQKKWIDSLQETHYFNRKGECEGLTCNSIESYNGWRGQKTHPINENY